MFRLLFIIIQDNFSKDKYAVADDENCSYFYVPERQMKVSQLQLKVLNSAHRAVVAAYGTANLALCSFINNRHLLFKNMIFVLANEAFSSATNS